MTEILPHERFVCFSIIRDILEEQNGDDVDAARNIAASIRSNPVLEDVSIESLEVHEDVWDILLDVVFHNRRVKTLDLTMPVDVKLARDIHQMSGLKELVIMFPTVFYNADADSFTRLFRSNRNLQRSRLTAGFASLGEALKWHSSLEHLSLDSKNFFLDAATATSLVEGIEQNSSLARLEIGCWEIPPASSEVIFQRLASHTTLRYIRFEGLRQGPDELVSLARFIEDNDTVETLSLLGNKRPQETEDDDVFESSVLDFELITSALCSNRALKPLNLYRFELQVRNGGILNGDDAHNTTLEEIFIDNSNLDADGMILLGRLIEKCSAVKNVSLLELMTMNDDSLLFLCTSLQEIQGLESLEFQVGDRGAAIVGEFIAGHATLKSLYLSIEDMTDVGFESISAGLKQNSTLVRLELVGIRRFSDNGFREYPRNQGSSIDTRNKITGLESSANGRTFLLFRKHWRGQRNIRMITAEIVSKLLQSWCTTSFRRSTSSFSRTYDEAGNAREVSDSLSALEKRRVVFALGIRLSIIVSYTYETRMYTVGARSLYHDNCLRMTSGIHIGSRGHRILILRDEYEVMERKSKSHVLVIKVRRGDAGRYGEEDGRFDDDESPTLLSNEGFTWRTGLVLTYT